MKDLYSVLGVPKDADAAAIKKAFKALARKYHPDVNKAAGAEQRFKEISSANDVLSDAEKRQLYDEFGDISLKPGFDAARARAFAGGNGNPFGGGGNPFAGFSGGNPFSGGGFGGINLEEMLGGAEFLNRGGGRRRASAGADLEGTLRVPFLDAVRGGEATVRVGDSTLTVKIPAGIEDGQVIRVRGKGQAGRNGGPPGDLLLNAAIESHDRLRRTGKDLELDLPVTLSEAIGGATIDVPTPTGKVRVKVPPGSGNGRRMRVGGHGVKGADGNGDLYLVIRPVLPSVSDEETMKLAAELDAKLVGDVRADLAL